MRISTIHIVRSVFVMLTSNPTASEPERVVDGSRSQITAGGGNSRFPLMKQTG